MIGRTLRQYRILEQLGQGGMGVVYKARDEQLGRFVAIKMLSPTFAATPERKRRFIQEARAASALNHPNIITIHDIVHEDGADFIVMEYVAGKSLDHLIPKEGLPLQEAMKYAIAVAGALAAAHASGIVHRDLKPANVLVSEQGAVKVLDFGLAKLLEKEATDPESPTVSLLALTEEGTVMGTVAYMSPEQAEGKRVDERSDVFSFGAVLYEMVTGRRAFERSSRTGTLAAVLRDNPPAATGLAPKVPPALERVIVRCLNKDPEQRFRNGAEVKTALDAVLDAPPPRALIMRRAALWTGIAALLLAVLIALRADLWRRASAWLTGPSVPETKLVAVLPFQNVGDNPDNEAFCDGLMETLSSKLTQLEQFHGSIWVAPANEIRAAAISSARHARTAMGVNLVVTGSVQREGDRIRLTANLVDTTTLRQLGARTIDTRSRDLVSLQDGVVREVASLLEIELKPDAERMLAAGQTGKTPAYENYLQARGLLHRYDREGNVAKAIGLFQEAIREDPNYALAHAGLAEAYLHEFGQTKDGKSLDRAREAVERTLELDENVASAYISAGAIEAHTGRHAEAIRKLERALQLDPMSAEALRELGRVYQSAGRFPEAESTFRRSIELRPYDWLGHSHLAVFYARRGRFSEAESALRRVIELTPDNSVGYRNLGGIYYYMGRLEDAAKMTERAIAIKPDAASRSNLGTIYYLLGRYPEAANVFEEAVEDAGAQDPTDYILLGNLASCYERIAESAAKAPDLYRRAIDAGQRHLEVNPNDSRVLSRLAGYRARLGDIPAALGLIEKAQRLGPTDSLVAYKSALVYQDAKQPEKAVAALEVAIRNGYSREEIRRSPEVESLRRHPRIQKLLSVR